MKRELTKNMGSVANILMTKIQAGFSYNWSDAFSYIEIHNKYKEIKEEMREIIGDITTLTVDELSELGFQKWSEEGALYLIPLWIYDLIPDGTELTSINGIKKRKGSQHIDLDIRFGCIAYGLDKSMTKEENK